MSFEVKTQEKDGKTILYFCGVIDEDASFPQVDCGAEITIDLQNVTSINSIGIRAWVMWFGDRETTKFIFVNCPKAVVMQMNMVDGFLPVQSEVISMFVPFYCEDCDKEKEVLFEVGKQVSVNNGQVELNFDKSSICGEACDPELDVVEAKFFRFLQKTSGNSNAA